MRYESCRMRWRFTPPWHEGHLLDLVYGCISKGWTLAVGQHGHTPNISYTLSNYTLFYPDRCENLVMLGSYLPIPSRTVSVFDKLPIRHPDTPAGTLSCIDFTYLFLSFSVQSCVQLCTVHNRKTGKKKDWEKVGFNLFSNNRY